MTGQAAALLMLATVVLGSHAGAQGPGPQLTRAPGSRVWVKQEGRTSWIAVTQAHRPLQEGDSIRVEVAGGVRLCLRDGSCSELPQGLHSVDPPADADGRGGLSFRTLARSALTLAGLLTQQRSGSERSSMPLVMHMERSAAERPEPPALLLADHTRIAAQPVRLVWIPGAGASADSAVRIRLYGDLPTGACVGGALLLDTLVTGNRLERPARAGADVVPSDTLGTANQLDLPGLGSGARYRVELRGSRDEAYGSGCLVTATDEERAALASRLEELRRELRSGSVSADAPTFDENLFVASLLVAEGFPYDALLMLHPLLVQAPGDPVLGALWEGVVVRAGLQGTNGR